MKFSCAISHIFVELDVKFVDKMQLLRKKQLKDEGNTFADWVRVFLNEVFVLLHKNDFGL